ncbi:MAG: YtrH family sporulation protein [Halanaerobium sp.]|nr:YtrH family sporulation protein [Halanaerobium sp.]
MERFVSVFFISLGIVLGGTLVGTIGSTIAGQPPSKSMLQLAEDLRLYGVVGAIGGSFTNLRLLEGSFFEGELWGVIRQLLVLVTAFLGANLASWIIGILAGGK